MTGTRDRHYPVQWGDSIWESALWRSQQTFSPVLELIETVARERGHAIMPVTVDGRGRIARGEVEKQGHPAEALVRAVHGIVRQLVCVDGARIVEQVDIRDGSGTERRMIKIRWDRQPVSTADQLRQLLRSVRTRSQYRIAKAWFGLTPRALQYLADGYREALKRGELACYKGELEVPANILSVNIPAPGRLRLILPHAVRAASRPGRRPVNARDEALAKLLDIFVAASGRTGASARRGDRDEPFGPGATFIRRIEAIFDIRLMPEGSTHAIARAAKLMRFRAQAAQIPHFVAN